MLATILAERNIAARSSPRREGRVKGTGELVISRSPFIVVYRVKGKRIEILRILHGAQQWPKAN
jgi:plasmid stabilization system protein ParE